IDRIVELLARSSEVLLVDFELLQHSTRIFLLQLLAGVRVHRVLIESAGILNGTLYFCAQSTEFAITTVQSLAIRLHVGADSLNGYPSLRVYGCQKRQIDD